MLAAALCFTYLLQDMIPAILEVNKPINFQCRQRKAPMFPGV